MIVAEALLGAQNGHGVSYSRRKVFYSIGKRYRAPAHTYTTVLGSVDELAQQGWLYGHRAAPNNRGWQSSFCATPELIAAAQDLAADPTFEVREPIRLKDDTDDLVDYPETRETLRIRRALEPINAYLKELRIELPGVTRQGQHLRIGDSQVLPIPGNGLQRIFSRGSFGCRGRAYGWWQNIPKNVRGSLLIDGEATAEVDYTALHPAILYCKRGLKFDGDAYEIDNFPRDQVKLGFNIAVNARTRRSAKGGIVAAQSRKAAEVGAEVPAASGDCVDAVVATTFALGVREPRMSGIGDGGAMVLTRLRAGQRRSGRSKLERAAGTVDRRDSRHRGLHGCREAWR
jgi:hypothetical protein